METLCMSMFLSFESQKKKSAYVNQLCYAPGWYDKSSIHNSYNHLLNF